MNIDAVIAERSSSCLKVCIVMDQRDVVSVVEKLKESFLHQVSGSKETGSTAQITAGTGGKTIIQYRRTLWKKMWIKKFMMLKINFGRREC